MTEKLVLGTVQLGMPYGINNKLGQPDFDCAHDIVKAAFDHGITYFDTAQAYGDSEKVLGQIFEKLALSSKVRVYSKLHPALDLCDEAAICHSVDESLRKLKVDHLEGLLLHREDAFDYWDRGLRTTINNLVKLGKVRTIGASFYAPEKALKALSLEGIDFIQVPANIFDQRFEKSGVFLKARDLKKGVFVRSIFLQGLLIMPVAAIPPHMIYMSEYIRKFSDMAENLGVSRQELAVGFVKQRYPGSFFVVGAEDCEQIIETARLFRIAKSLGSQTAFGGDIPENVLNPSLWPQA